MPQSDGGLIVQLIVDLSGLSTTSDGKCERLNMLFRRFVLVYHRVRQVCHRPECKRRSNQERTEGQSRFAYMCRTKRQSRWHLRPVLVGRVLFVCMVQT